MARGFGATRGVGTTDTILSAFNTMPSVLSVYIAVYRNGEGGSNTGRMFDAGNKLCLRSNNSSAANTYAIDVNSNATTWRWTRPAASEWSSIGFSMDRTSNSNSPIVYQNGSSVSLTLTGAIDYTTGTATNWAVGNRNSDKARNWDGDLAEFAVWDLILTSGEFASLASGASPKSIQAANLVEYIPMLTGVSPTSCVVANPTVTGTASQTHPYSSDGCDWTGGTELLSGSACTGAQGAYTLGTAVPL
jgi:hypothetical protein